MLRSRPDVTPMATVAPAGTRPRGQLRVAAPTRALLVMGLLVASVLTPPLSTATAMPAIAGAQAAAAAVRKPAPASDPLGQVQRRIVQVPVLRGEFAQEKRLQGFRNPLRSQGRFVIARDRGVLWSTLKPFPSDVVLTRDRILTRQADGRSRIEVDARQQPALRSVNAMMFALMSGDVQAMTASFNVQPTLLPGSGWRLVLTPKAGAMAQAFQRVTLEGDRYVRGVEIEERSGDRTQLRFTGMVETPSRLTADEARRFD